MSRATLAQALFQPRSRDQLRLAHGMGPLLSRDGGKTFQWITYNLPCLEGPRDADGRIIPGQHPRVRRIPWCGDFIRVDHMVAEREKAVGEAGGDPELLAVLRAELHRRPFAVGR